MTQHELLVILGMAAVTFGIRYSFFVLGDRVAFPAWVRRALHYVPVAVLTAIVVPMVLLPDGTHWQLTWRNAWLVGATHQRRHGLEAACPSSPPSAAPWRSISCGGWWRG